MSGTARAQSDPWLVLRAIPGDDPPGFAQATDQFETALRREVTILPREAAAQLVAERHSSEPSSASQDEFDLLARESEEALEHVAFGRRRRARAAVERILDRARGALEALNREARSARQVLNSCLYLVRALVDADDRTAALAQSLECARLVPDMQPSASDHPPHVRELFAQAIQQLSAGPHGALLVRSEPSGCAVYVNGRRLGQTPFERADLPTGAYSVQVECDSGRPGRVHRIMLSAEARELVIDTSFDRALRTTAGEVRLDYPDPETEVRRRLADVRRVAAILRTEPVVVMTPEAPDVLRVDRVRARDGAVVASVRVGLAANGLSRRAVSALVEALVAGRSVDVREDPPRAIEPWSPPSVRPAVAAGAGGGGAPAEGVAVGSAEAGSSAPEEPGGEGSGGPAWLGWTLAGGGVLGLGAAWVLEAQLFTYADQLRIAQPSDVDYLDRQERVSSARAPVLASGIAGGALLGASLPLILPSEDGVPWWGWVAGGVGAGTAALGVVYLAGEQECLDEGCAQREPNDVLGALVLSHAAPLLAVPVVYLVRGASESDGATASVSLGPGGGSVSVGGAF